jgi:pilus assembly protein FimV
LGLALIAAGIVGWLLMRRKPAPTPGRSFQTSALAAGMPSSGVAMRDADDDDDDIEEDAETDSSDDSDDDDVDPEVADRGPGSDGQNASDSTNWNTPPADSDEMASPTWHSGSRPVASTDQPPPREPARQAGSPDPAPAGNDHVELARAYIDLGDADTARSLLQEVAEGGDADARDEARRLLREMG